jgi:hypothetical protein
MAVKAVKSNLFFTYLHLFCLLLFTFKNERNAVISQCVKIKISYYYVTPFQNVSLSI